MFWKAFGNVLETASPSLPPLPQPALKWLPRHQKSTFVNFALFLFPHQSCGWQWVTFHLSPLEVGIGVEVLVSDYFDWPRPAAGGNVHDAPLPNNLLLILIKHTDPKLLLIVDGLILPSIKTA